MGSHYTGRPERGKPPYLASRLTTANPRVILTIQSDSDNVIIEVKRHSSLKGSNDLVKLAERVSAHPDWRLELVVPDDARDESSFGQDQSFKQIIKKVSFAISVKLYDLAYVYLTDVLIRMAHDLALANHLKIRNISDNGILMELGFKGILPDDLLQNCLNALAARNEFIHPDDGGKAASESEVTRLIELCGHLSELL